jgi:triosephosphate isomerase
MRPPLIAGNWKMNGTLRESVELAKAVRKSLENFEAAEVLIAPPFLALHEVRKVIEGSRLKLGAQDMHWEPKGAYTGEVSSTMLKDAGVTHAILGHSERRHVIGEGNDLINKKVRHAVAAGITPIVCVGELLEERNMKVTKDVVERQTTKAMEGIQPAEASGVVFAYEPVWAIGTGLTATPFTAQEVHHFIRNVLGRLVGTGVAENIRILYGGSVKPDNARELMDQADVDGLLVGGASLDAAAFNKIARYKES